MLKSALHKEPVIAVTETKEVRRFSEYPMPVDPYKSALITSDGHEITEGMRVFNYYDGKWGVVMHISDHDGWFTLHQKDGSKTLLNGERVCMTEVK